MEASESALMRYPDTSTQDSDRGVGLGEKNGGYLTPGWGPQGAQIVNPGVLFDAYANAGFGITS